MSADGDAALVAALFAVDPAGTGGVCLRSQVQPARDHWLELLRELLPPDAPLKRIPFNIGAGRLLGGLDLTATLKANRPIAERGVLAATDGGVLIVSMAERLGEHAAACLNAVLDTGEVTLLREAVSGRAAARLGVVALDEGIGEDEHLPLSLLDRLAFLLDLESHAGRPSLIPLHDAEDIAAARRLLPRVHLADDLLERLCATAMSFGVDSPRVAWLALRVARAAAALEGRTVVTEEEVIVAARLVMAPRASVLPPAALPQPADPPQPRSDAEQNDAKAQSTPAESGRNPMEPPPHSAASSTQPPASPSPPPPLGGDEALNDRVLSAVRAAIPHGLLARLQAGDEARQRAGGAGRAGGQRRSSGRGRPAGVRSGMPRADARLNVLETLRAAAPWQRLRGRDFAGDARLRVRAADFRITVCKQRSRTLTVFVVDASGSSALNRLAEAKGAVELLLGECYLRRDQVAVIAFRGREADLLLPPTRSLVRAKRSLAGMPGGGGTPLAAALTAAAAVAVQAQRRGETPTVVVLSDGRANVARDRTPGREPAQRDAMAAAAAFRRSKIQALFVDTSPRPNPLAGALAAAMNARYIPLPYATSRALSDVVKAVAAAG